MGGDLKVTMMRRGQLLFTLIAILLVTGVAGADWVYICSDSYGNRTYYNTAGIQRHEGFISVEIRTDTVEPYPQGSIGPVLLIDFDPCKMRTRELSGTTIGTGHHISDYGLFCVDGYISDLDGQEWRLCRPGSLRAKVWEVCSKL